MLLLIFSLYLYRIVLLWCCAAAPLASLEPCEGQAKRKRVARQHHLVVRSLTLSPGCCRPSARHRTRYVPPPPALPLSPSGAERAFSSGTRAYGGLEPSFALWQRLFFFFAPCAGRGEDVAEWLFSTAVRSERALSPLSLILPLPRLDSSALLWGAAFAAGKHCSSVAALSPHGPRPVLSDLPTHFFWGAKRNKQRGQEVVMRAQYRCLARCHFH